MLELFPLSHLSLVIELEVNQQLAVQSGGRVNLSIFKFKEGILRGHVK